MVYCLIGTKLLLEPILTSGMPSGIYQMNILYLHDFCEKIQWKFVINIVDILSNMLTVLEDFL